MADQPPYTQNTRLCCGRPLFVSLTNSCTVSGSRGVPMGPHPRSENALCRRSWSSGNGQKDSDFDRPRAPRLGCRMRAWPAPMRPLRRRRYVFEVDEVHIDPARRTCKEAVGARTPRERSECAPPCLALSSCGPAGSDHFHRADGVSPCRTSTTRHWGPKPTGTDLRLDGFLGPGHVSTVIGQRPYRFVSAQYGLPLVT